MHTVNNILIPQRSYLAWSSGHTVDSTTSVLDSEASSSDSAAIVGHNFDLSGTLEITIILLQLLVHDKYGKL